MLRELHAAVGEALAISRGMNEDQCRLATVAEGWPAVIVAYHIGLGLRRQAGFIGRALTGEAPFEFGVGDAGVCTTGWFANNPKRKQHHDHPWERRWGQCVRHFW